MSDSDEGGEEWRKRPVRRSHGRSSTNSFSGGQCCGVLAAFLLSGLVVVVLAVWAIRANNSQTSLELEASPVNAISPYGSMATAGTTGPPNSQGLLHPWFPANPSNVPPNNNYKPDQTAQAQTTAWPFFWNSETTANGGMGANPSGNVNSNTNLFPNWNANHHQHVPQNTNLNSNPSQNANSNPNLNPIPNSNQNPNPNPNPNPSSNPNPNSNVNANVNLNQNQNQNFNPNPSSNSNLGPTMNQATFNPSLVSSSSVASPLPASSSSANLASSATADGGQAKGRALSLSRVKDTRANEPNPPPNWVSSFSASVFPNGKPSLIYQPGGSGNPLPNVPSGHVGQQLPIAVLSPQGGVSSITVLYHAPFFFVSIPVQPSTGYQWYPLSYDSRYVDFIESQFVPTTNPSGLIGAVSGYKVWLWRAKKQLYYDCVSSIIQFQASRGGGFSSFSPHRDTWTAQGNHPSGSSGGIFTHNNNPSSTLNHFGPAQGNVEGQQNWHGGGGGPGGGFGISPQHFSNHGNGNWHIGNIGNIGNPNPWIVGGSPYPIYGSAYPSLSGENAYVEVLPNQCIW